MNRLVAIVLALAMLGLEGCSSTLVVKDTKGAELSGFPVRISEPYVVEFKRTEHSEKGTKCSHTKGYKHVVLPTGERLYVAVDPELFASTSLELGYSETGTVQKLLFNSAPSAEAITAATTALTSLLPFLGILPSVADPAVQTEQVADPGDSTEPACDAGETITSIKRLEGYISSELAQ